MKIKFVAPDPRAGMVAQMDSSRGQQLIDAGCAEPFREGEPVVQEPARAQADDAQGDGGVEAPAKQGRRGKK